MLIKNIIEYYYNINDIVLYKYSNYYKFVYKGFEYLFMPLISYDIELSDIDSVIHNLSDYDQLILNRNNSFITIDYNRKYILIKKSKYRDSLENMLIKSEMNIVLDYNKSINKSNWVELWSKKIDYIEYQINHNENEYKIVRNSINYYIGMAESAIQYVNNTIENEKKQMQKLVISHRRIKDKNFNNPLNIIIDYRSRDVSEYLKYIFFNNQYDYCKIKKFLYRLNFDQYDFQLVYGRMLFPTFYFDMYDNIINGNKNEDELKIIINRVVEYEDYLKNIYIMINEIKKIPEVSWL